jgi:hypothetical protein
LSFFSYSEEYLLKLPLNGTCVPSKNKSIKEFQKERAVSLVVMECTVLEQMTSTPRVSFGL